MIADIYNNQIMNFAHSIVHEGRLTSPHVSATMTAKLCGSSIIVDLCVENGLVSDFATEVQACLLGRATTAIMSSHIIKAPILEYHTVSTHFRNMLKGNDFTFSPRFADLYALEPLRDYKLRHGSILLVFDALDECLQNVQ
jgi:NifU-like protein involved in Fe-S cluster formation